MKVHKRSEYSFINFYSGTVRSFISLILSLVATPITLKYLGPKNYGSVRVLGEIFGNFAVLEFGIVNTLMNLFPKSIASDDRKETRSILKLGLVYYLKSSVLMVLTGTIVYFFLDNIITVETSMVKDLRSAYAIFALTCLLAPFQVFRSLFESMGKSGTVNFSIILYSLTCSTLSMLFAYMGLAMFGQAVAILIALFFSGMYLVYKSPFKLSSVFKEKTLNAKKDFWKIGVSSYISDIAGRLCLFSDSIIISIFLGPSIVTPFYITQRLPTILQTQLQNIGGSTWAALGNIYHQNDLELFCTRLIELSKIVAVISVSTLLPLCLLNHEFINIWIGTQNFVSDLFNYVVILNSFFLPLFTLWGWSFTSAGKINLLTPMLVVQAIINLSLNIFLTKNYGSIGPVLATLCSYVLIPSWWIPILMKKYYRISFLKIVFAWLPSMIIGICLFLLIKNFLYPLSKVDNYIKFFFFYIIYFSVSFSILYLFIFNKEEKRIIKERLNKILNKFKLVR